MPTAPAEPPLAQRLAAEGIGAFFLFATVIGSGIMAEKLAGGIGALALADASSPGTDATAASIRTAARRRCRSCELQVDFFVVRRRDSLVHEKWHG